MKLNEKPSETPGCLVGTRGWTAESCHSREMMGERGQDPGTLPY